MSDPSSRPATGYPAPPPPPSNGYPFSTTAYPYAPPQTTTAAAAAAYYNPYAAAVPQPPNLLLRRMFSIVTASLITLAVIILILWFILRPRVPLFTLTSLSLTNLTTTSTSNSYISATWSVSLSISNPNKHLHAYFDDVTVYVFYRNVALAQNQVAPFDVGRRGGTKNVGTVLVAKEEYVGGGVVESVVGEEGKGRVVFDVRVLAIVRFNDGAWRVRRKVLRVLCANLGVGVSANSSSSSGSGMLSGGPRNCASYL